MDKATRNTIERATQQARKLLDEDFSSQLEGTFDVLRSGVIASKGGGHLSPVQRSQRRTIVAAIEHKCAAVMNAVEAVTDYVRDAAFTTLNRFVALKMLEARELVQECITKGEESAGYREFCGMAPGIALLPDAEGYRLYIESLFDEFSTEIKVLFDRRDAASVLWPKRQTFEALLAILNTQDLSGVWGDDETIGWVYQFFNSGEERKKMREESQAPRNSRELAVRNQFFTPRYVVQFLTDNTLGRLWVEMQGDRTRLNSICEYLAHSADETVQSHPRKDPRDLRILDPACGSGHFLLYAFDLLLVIYEEAWSVEGAAPKSEATGRTLRDDYADLIDLRRAAPRLIVEQNLHGVDIDPRCAQIAALALWLRAQRAWKDLGVVSSERPRINRTHIVVAEPMPGDARLVEEFAARLAPPLLRDLFKKMIDESRLAGELGVLLQVEDGIATELTRAREEFVKQRQSTGFLPGMEPMATQGALDLSGIDDARFFHEAEARIVEALRNFAETASLSASVRKRLFAGDAVQGIALIDLVRTQFDVMLMNPPFGELSEAGKEALSRGRARRPLDAYTQFLYRSVELLADGGSVGALVSKTFMTHAEFEPTRRWLLSNAGSLRHFAELGTGVLDAAVEVAAITLAPGAVDATCFFDVTDSISKGDTLRNACESKDNDRLFVRNHAQFLCRPGAPLAYRLSAEVMASIMEESTLADLVDGAWGLFTAADSRFVRAWWEVDPKALGTIWLPFAKGGTPRSFFSEPLLVVRWDANGSEILSRKGDRGQTLARAPNKDKYERPGLTYSSISSSGFRVRPLNEGSIFSIKGPALFPTVTRAHWLPLLDMLNTGEISYLLSTLSSNRSAELNYALRISIPRDWKRYFTGHISKQLFRLQRWFSTGSETSRYFLGFPLDRDQRGPLGTILVSELIQKLNEAGCNAFSKFGFDDEAIARYRPSAQHLSSQPKVDLHSVLSYLVGVAFGRWRSSAIAPCEREEQLSDEFASVPRLPGAALSEMLHVPDMPGVLVDDPGHCADITALVSQYGRVLNAPHVPLEDPDLIRGILRNDFFLAHITSYSEAGRRAPIYWQLSTPSASYSVWLYTHAFSPDTLYKVQNDFIATKLAHEERKLEEMRAEFDRSTPAVRLKEHVTQEAFVDELRTFSVEVKLVAPVWRPTIDDGVVINFAPLWRLVPHQNAWQKELKLAWDKLVDGEEDWAHLAMRLWPERVVPKCANDRSLAIAHGLEDTFWVEADDGKWKPRSIPTRSVEELVRDMTSSSVKAALKKLLEAPVPSAAASRGRGGHRIANTVVNRGAH